MVEGKLPEKQFLVRDSSLSVALQDKYVRFVYNVIRSAIIVLALRNALNDIYYDGGSWFGFRLIYEGFKDISITFVVWTILLAIHFGVYFGWNLWSLGHSSNKAWHYFWICLAWLVFFGTLHWVAHFCTTHNISLCCRAILLTEQLRFIMKGYSFVRRKSEEIRANRGCRPNLRHYVYYTFAPTLLYRDSYPRKPSRDWNKIVKYVFDFLLALYALSLIEDVVFIKPLEHFGSRPFTILDIGWTVLKYAPFGILLPVIAIQYMGLHLVQCFFGELLRFGDQLFFGEWWTLDDPAKVARSWNHLVQDWLYEHVYRDFLLHVAPSNKPVARFAVIVLSMVFHEIPMMLALEITCPVFGLHAVFMLMAKSVPKSNRDSIVGMLLLQSFTFVLPHLEYFAKQNCEGTTNATVYWPKLWSC